MAAPMRCAPALLKVSTFQPAPSSERHAAAQSVLPSVGATKPSSETDTFRTSEDMRCLLPWSGGVDGLEQGVDLADRGVHALLHAHRELLHLLSVGELDQDGHASAGGDGFERDAG